MRSELIQIIVMKVQPVFPRAPGCTDCIRGVTYTHPAHPGEDKTLTETDFSPATTSWAGVNPGSAGFLAGSARCLRFGNTVGNQPREACCQCPTPLDTKQGPVSSRRIEPEFREEPSSHEPDTRHRAGNRLGQAALSSPCSPGQRHSGSHRSL